MAPGRSSGLPLLSLGVMRSLVRKQGVRGVLSSLVVLPILNAFIIGGLYQTINGAPYDLESFGGLFPYFVASAAFVAGAASWEQELLSAILPSYVGRPYKAVVSRIGYVVLSTAPFLVLFFVIRAFTASGQLISDASAMLAISTGCVFLGMGTAIGFGFQNDKGVNNIVQVAPWIFALGPGPFFPVGIPWIGWLFPGGSIDMGTWTEFVRCGAFTVVGVVLLWRGLGARRSPVFVP